jgi:hypothetical protein
MVLYIGEVIRNGGEIVNLVHKIKVLLCYRLVLFNQARLSKEYRGETS